MTHELQTGPAPNARQTEWIQRMGQRAAAAVAEGKLEFTPLRVIDRLRLELHPRFEVLVQRAIYEACLESGHETQSFRPYVYRGDSASPYEPLTVRVTQHEDVVGLSAAAEGGPIPGRNGYLAIDVYPPQD